MKKTVITLSLCASVILQAQTNEATLAGVTITSATKSQQSIQDVTSNVEVITGVELEEKKIKTLTQALRMKGIPVAQSGGIGQQSSFFLRGFSAGNTKVLIDGVSYNDPTTTEGQAQLEHLIISDIKRIEIIKGPQSGVWGADATAGVINIITKKAQKELQVYFNSELGTNDYQSYKFNISQKIDNFSYYFGAHLLQSDEISAQTVNTNDPNNYEDDKYKNTTINTKLSYDITDNDSLNFSIINIDGKAEYDGWGMPDDSTKELKQKNNIYTAEYKHSLESGYIKARYEKTQFKKDDPQGWTKKFRGEVEKYSLQSQFDYNNEDFIVMGVENTESENEISDKSIDNKAIFVTNSNKLDSIILTQSLRYDEFDKFENKATAKIGLKYFIDNEVSVSANYGTSYKAPSLYQLYDPTYGNTNLKPESSQGFDLTFDYKSFSLTYYENKVDDLIGFDPVTYVNEQVSGTSTFKGYEARYENQVYENLLLGVNYNRAFAKDSDGKYLQRRARTTAGVSLDYYGFSKTHLGVYANYVGTRYDELAQTNQTGRYTLVDAVIDYDITKNFSTYLKVENATDKRYQEVYGYGTPGRTFKVGLNAKF